VQPTRGYVLFTLPTGRRIASADGLAKNGRLVAHMAFPPPPKR